MYENALRKMRSTSAYTGDTFLHSSINSMLFMSYELVMLFVSLLSLILNIFIAEQLHLIVNNCLCCQIMMEKQSKKRMLDYIFR